LIRPEISTPSGPTATHQDGGINRPRRSLDRPGAVNPLDDRMNIMPWIVAVIPDVSISFGITPAAVTTNARWDINMAQTRMG
jgi:hypothetical protein